jgi:hypothetical protein
MRVRGDWGFDGAHADRFFGAAAETEARGARSCIIMMFIFLLLILKHQQQLQLLLQLQKQKRAARPSIPSTVSEHSARKCSSLSFSSACSR